MNSHQISYALEQAVYPHAYIIGVASIDQLPTISQSYPSCIIVNTSPSYHPGSHWCAYYLESPYHIEFFDSFGFAPSKYRFKLCAHRSNYKKLQSQFSSVCGAYCLFFLYYRCRGLSMSEILSMFITAPNMTDHDCLENDRKVNSFTHKFLKCPFM